MGPITKSGNGGTGGSPQLERATVSTRGRDDRAWPAVTRDGSKKAEVIGLLQRKGGATLT